MALAPTGSLAVRTQTDFRPNSFAPNSLTDQNDIKKTPGYLIGKHVVRPMIRDIGTGAEWARQAFLNFYSREIAPIFASPIEIPPNFVRLEEGVPVPYWRERNHFDIPLQTQISHSRLLEKFKKIAHIGGGGDASVYKVRDKSTGKLYAMTVRHEMRRLSLGSETELFERIMKVQNRNPHLAKTFAAFWLEIKNYPYSGGEKRGVLPFSDLKEGEFTRTDFENDPDAKTYYRQVLVLELGLGDLESTAFRELKADPLDVGVQICFNNYQLDRAGIIPSDQKWRNYIWTSLEGQYFKGKLVENYAFFHYQFGEYHLYLKNPGFLVKRVDLTEWALSDPVDNPLGYLEAFAASEQLSLSDLLTRYSKPEGVSDGAILEMQ